MPPRHTRRHGPTATAGQAPVAYVLVPPAASAKTLAIEFARYLGIPVTAGMSQAQITNAVCHTYTSAGVQLVMIDEIHRLNPRTTTGAQSADLIKDLTERIGATFVYAGIDVTTTPLFTGVRGAQLAGRASLIDCAAFPARLGNEEPFRDLITAMEGALDLRHHWPGALPRLAPYLHERTAGRIGSLARLIRQAAITALIDKAPNASPKPPSTPSASTTLPNSTTNPAPGPGAGIPTPRDPDRRHGPYRGRSRPRAARRPHPQRHGYGPHQQHRACSAYGRCSARRPPHTASASPKLSG